MAVTDYAYDFAHPEKVQGDRSKRLQRQRTIQLGMDMMRETVYGKAAQVCDDIGSLLLDHVKTVYVRPITGKGFTDRTGDLRASIAANVTFVDHRFIIKFSAGMVYAKVVEMIKDGTYAYFMPTVTDCMPQIRDLIKREMSVKTLEGSQIGRARIADLIARGKAVEASAR
jgi:hypothetical protein